MADGSMTSTAALVQGLFAREDGLRMLLEHLLQEAMAGEVAAHLGAQAHQRSSARTGYRNGTKSRRLQTRLGPLELAVPQVRNCEPYHPSMFARYQRSERALLVACAEMYFQGVSTRRVQAVLEELGGSELSAMTVSRVAAELDEKLAEFRTRALGHTAWPYLIVDARYEKVRVSGRVVSQAVLVTAGIDACGRREVLDFRVADSESAATWGELFGSLKERGLRGVELVVSDAHAGIRAAAGRHFQGAAWQRCRVHLMREVAQRVGYKAAKGCMAELRSVYRGETAAECLRRGEELAAAWAEKHARAAELLRTGLADTLAVWSFPESHRRKLGSTNLLERGMRTILARTRVVGVFPNPASCERLCGAVLLEIHEQWQLEPGAYVTMNR